MSGSVGREVVHGGLGAVRVSAHRDGGGAVGPGPRPWLGGERHAVASGVTSWWLSGVQSSPPGLSLLRWREMTRGKGPGPGEPLVFRVIGYY